MAEYIEREAAFNAILKLVPKVDGDGYCWVIRGDAATAIDNIPAADVRPVVLCKDCKCYQQSSFIDNHMECARSGFAVHSVDFCSRGEKREES